MSFLLRDKQPQSLYQAFEIAIDIECNLKYGFIRRITPTVVKNLAEISESKACANGNPLLQRGVDSFIVENSTYVYNVTSAKDKVSSLDEVYTQDVSLPSPFPTSDFLHDENIMNHEEESCSSQYEDEEARTDVSNEGEVVHPMYNQEASYEVDDEICCSSQEEDHDSICSSSCEWDTNWEEESNNESDYSHASNGMISCFKLENDSTYSSSCELDANWEEERNDRSCHSYESKGISSFSKSESEIPF